jgi:UDP-glucose 4-epimerase
MTEYTGIPVLVTGGAGFIGSHLVEALVARGAHVTVVDNLSTGLRRNLTAVLDRVDIQPLDLRQDDLRPLLRDKAFTCIFHVAANAHVQGSVANPRLDFENNIVSTFNLLEAMREAAPDARLVHTSTAAVYGSGSPAMREDDPTVPIAPYGVSKLASERYVAIYPSLYGLKTANVRVFPVYGPRLRKQVVYDLMLKIHRNREELLVYGDGTQVRDFNHVANVVEALLLVAGRAPLTGDVYNVAADEFITIRELVGMLCERMNARPRLVYTGDAGAGVSQRFSADTSKLKALGYQPRISLAEGLTQTVEWFRNEMTNQPS